MGNDIKQLFEAFRNRYNDHDTFARSHLLDATDSCLEVEGVQKPDGTASAQAFKSCLAVATAAYDDEWSHNIYEYDYVAFSAYSIAVDVGGARRCVEIRKDFVAAVKFSMRFCNGKELKNYNVGSDGKIHGLEQDKENLLALKGAVLAATGRELPVVIDSPYAYYLYGTTIKLWSSTESVDLVASK